MQLTHWIDSVDDDDDVDDDVDDDDHGDHGHHHLKKPRKKIFLPLLAFVEQAAFYKMVSQER